MFVRKQTGKTLIRLLLKKQSDLGLHCLFWLFFWQATSVQHLRISTILLRPLPVFTLEVYVCPSVCLLKSGSGDSTKTIHASLM